MSVLQVDITYKVNVKKNTPYTIGVKKYQNYEYHIKNTPKKRQMDVKK